MINGLIITEPAGLGPFNSVISQFFGAQLQLPNETTIVNKTIVYINSTGCDTEDYVYLNNSIAMIPRGTLKIRI
jgi:hypothetical protein